MATFKTAYSAKNQARVMPHYHGRESYEYVNSKEVQFCSFVKKRPRYWRVRQRRHAGVSVLSKLRQYELKQAQLQQD